MRVLTVQCGPNAVQEYRFNRAKAHMKDIDFTVLDFDDYIQNSAVSTIKDAETEERITGVPARAVLLSKWIAENGTDYDLIWTNDHRLELVAFVEQMMDSGTPVVADCDDWFLDLPHENSARKAWHPMKKRVFKQLLNGATQMVGSTPKIANEFGGEVVPNFVDPDEWKHPPRDKWNDEIVIACPAGSGRIGDYMPLEGALSRCLEEHNVKVVFMGWMPEWAFRFKPGQVIYSQWVSMDLYPRLLAYVNPDIVISPMLHNDFNEAKSNLKWLESGAVGACFVGEDWGEYRRTVEDGITGVLANGTDDWSDKLSWLCQDHVKRRTIAQSGQEAVLANWTWKSVGGTWRDVILGAGNKAESAACA